MDTTSLLMVILGVLVRVAIPVLITALIAYGLHRLDARWQAEAEREQQQLIKHEIPCWKEQGISAEQMRLRAVVNDQPCWQMRRLPNGYLQEDCLECEVFHSTPVPPIHSHVHTFKL